MNSQRRKTLERASSLIGEARELIQQAMDEEQEAFDNMPESLQQGDKGQRAEENVSNLSDAIDGLETVDGTIQEAIYG